MPYQPIEDFQQTDDDHSSDRIRDMPYGLKRENLSLYPNEITFGNVVVSATSPSQTILLRNEGYDDVEIEDVIVVGDFIYTPSDITTIEPGETIPLLVSFHPGRTGALTGGLHVKTVNALGHKFIKLLGTGISGP